MDALKVGSRPILNAVWYDDIGDLPGRISYVRNRKAILWSEGGITRWAWWDTHYMTFIRLHFSPSPMGSMEGAVWN